MPRFSDPRLLVGNETGDDAAVVRLRDDLAVVHSLDFFMPIVDKPYHFGQIAAANALSDVYAMGATPTSALAILGYPTKKLPVEVAAEIMRGGADICHRAGVALSGGHSIDDAEPKFGLSVSGILHPDEIWTNAGAQVGDAIVLTKPLGVGSMGSAIKKGRLSAEQYDDFLRTTTHLNASAMRAGRTVGVHAATDVTGFGLVGHLFEMCKGANLTAAISFGALPVLDGAIELIASGVVPGATGRNLQHLGSRLSLASTLPPNAEKLLADPQTSGGLLFAVAPEKAQELCESLRSEGALCAVQIGSFQAGTPGIQVVD